MKILLTGSNGYLGKHIKSLDYDITCVPDYLPTDLNKYDFDYLFHFGTKNYNLFIM